MCCNEASFGGLRDNQAAARVGCPRWRILPRSNGRVNNNYS